MNKKQILIEQKHVYGVVKNYPICEQAKLFAQIANTTTLTDHVLKLIYDLGYIIKIVPVETKGWIEKG